MNRMPEERNWMWIERIFKLIPKQIPYPVTYLVLAGLLLFIFWFLSRKVFFFPWDFYHQLEASALCILLAFQLTGIQYVLDDMKKTSREIRYYPENKEMIDELLKKFKQSFSASCKYYIIIGAI